LNFDFHTLDSAGYRIPTKAGWRPSLSLDEQMLKLMIIVFLKCQGKWQTCTCHTGDNRRHFNRKIELAWNGTREASRTAFIALPFLQNADEIFLLGAELASRDDGLMRDSKNEFAEVPTRQGAKVSTEPTDHRQDITDGEKLLSCVTKHSADLLVMGVYGHSRTREFIRGDATKHVLALTTVPVLMSH
jgi:nucleotide-binding universal stress UspA family protein